MDNARTMHLLSLCAGALSAVACIAMVLTATSGVTADGYASCTIDPGFFCVMAASLLLSAWAWDRKQILSRTRKQSTSGQGA